MRSHQHPRLRRDHRRREQPSRDQPKPVGPRALAGRLERRRRRGGRRWDVPARPRQRRRRLDPHPRFLLRPCRSEAQPRARAASGAELAGRRRGGRGDAHSRRLRRRARHDRQVRSRRLVQRPGARPAVLRGPPGPAGAAANRPDGLRTPRHPHRRGLCRRCASGRNGARGARPLRRGGRGADDLRRDDPLVHRAHAGWTGRLRGRRLVGDRAAHRPPAKAQWRNRRIRLRSRRAHAGAAQPPGGHSLGARLRRAAHPHLGDPPTAGRRDPRRPARRARGAGPRRRRERLVHGLRQRHRPARRQPAAAPHRRRAAGRRAAHRRAVG